MSKDSKITLSSRVRNMLTGEIGVVLDIIGETESPFGYIVQTQNGIRRWIIRRETSGSSN